MVSMKIFVVIILTKLERSESTANVNKTFYAAGTEISSPKRTPQARMVQTDVIFEASIEFYPQTT